MLGSFLGTSELRSTATSHSSANSIGILTAAFPSQGDSGFVHLRPYVVHYYPNPPSLMPSIPHASFLSARLGSLHGLVPLCDFPRDANVTSHVVRHGDLLIFAMDGVCDYLSPSKNLKIVSEDITNFYAWQTEEKGTSGGRRLKDLIKEEYPPRR